MVEKEFRYTVTHEKMIEKIIEDDNIGLNHMVLCKGEALPEHYANSNVYMIVTGGQVTLRLDEQEPHTYSAGSILNIPYKTKMNVSNEYAQVLEFFVIKAPSPKHMK